jgi:gliding motility-associated-like protein
MVQFTYDTAAVQSFMQVNDSTYQLLFKASWRGYIKGSLAGCTIHRDSILLTVLQAPALLQLGPDTSICTGNNIVLNAHTGYASYRWQDGSTDSIFIVTQPGVYFVTTSNACGDHFSDTINVQLHASILLSLGNDLSICKKDTATIIAPADFISYQWSPAYQINQLSGSSVRVNPLVDTTYFVKAEKSPGCFAYDTIRVTVNKSPLIKLGNDTSFCAGDSILMDAGAGFQQYEWNIGANSQQFLAKSVGQYIVKATTSAGCVSTDSLTVMQAYTNPIVNLGTDTILCKGTNRLLDAGLFAQYLWNTGYTSQQININDTGYYKVQVTDINHCKGNGGLYISTLVNPPASFLPADTAICSYGEVVLMANKSYAAYLWNNGKTNPTITITQPGLYWLQATDAYHCVGKDSLIVLQKECMKGLYVPTAFSPNQDGKNDVFKPLIFGDVKLFQWVLYNRYGQIVFSTNNPTKGWDGRVNGELQNTGSFIWVCHYQFLGEKEQEKSGNVMLIR